MAKLGVITDGISRDFDHALGVMKSEGLDYAELQFLWDKEVGDLTASEVDRAKDLLDKHEAKVSCISRHNFVGMLVGETNATSEGYIRHMDGLRRCIEMAHTLDCSLVRIMSFRREMILFGEGGADHWVAATGAWEKLIELLQQPVELAQKEGITLVLETGNNAMIPSGYLGGKLIREVNNPHLRILWDPGNCLYASEPTYPDSYEGLTCDAIGHIHMKDCFVHMPQAKVTFTEFGKGQMADHFTPTAKALERDGYEGIISLESVYRPANGSFEDGFRASVELFKRTFG